MKYPGVLGLLCASLALSIVARPAAAQQSPPSSPQAKKVVDLVRKAATLIEQRGMVAAFAEFRQPGSEWFSGATYLFSYDLDGKVLLNPAFPKREGTNPAKASEKDAKGKLFHEEIIKVARTGGEGWVDYWFPRPGQTNPSHKWTYVKAVKLDGIPGLIGAGFYPDS